MVLSPRMFLVALLVVMTGCAPLATRPGARSGGAGPSASAPDPAAPDNSPRMIIPATGGAPVLGIPVGGGLYIPVTGGAPVPGTPI